MAGKINKEWHHEHPMPTKATLEQRVAWHREHQKHCDCRPGYPPKLLAEMKRRGIKP